MMDYLHCVIQVTRKSKSLCWLFQCVTNIHTTHTHTHTNGQTFAFMMFSETSQLRGIYYIAQVYVQKQFTTRQFETTGMRSGAGPTALRAFQGTRVSTYAAYFPNPDS